MPTPRIHPDFDNADVSERLRLDRSGAFRDSANLELSLVDGLRVVAHDEREADGIVRHSAEERVRVAGVDWGAIRPASEPAIAPHV